MKESRLIGYTIDQINKQRASVDATPIAQKVVDAKTRTWSYTDPVGTSNRAAENNAALQNQDHIQQLNTLKTSNLSVDQQAQSGNAPISVDTRISSAVSPTIKTGPSLTTTTSSNIIKPLAGSDLQSAVERRKQQRLMELGIPQDSFNQANTILSEGGRIFQEVGGVPQFRMPDGTVRTIEGVNATTAQNAIKAAQHDFTSEVKQESQSAVDQANKKAKEDAAANNHQETKTAPIQMPTFDMSSLSQTASQLTEVMNLVKGLDPSVQTAILPQLLQLQQENSQIQNLVNDMASQYATDAELAASGQEQEDYVTSTEAKWLSVLEKNKQIALDAADYSKKSLEIDKQINDHSATVMEQQQAVANVEGEKKLRRQLNALGIQTDLQGLNFLQTTIQKGVDALNNLKISNNLTSLKAQLAIGEGYKLDVRSALADYEGKYLDITTQTQAKLDSITNSISMAKSDRTKGIIEAYKWGLEQKSENDKEKRSIIESAQKRMDEQLNQVRDDERAQTKENKDSAYQMFNFAFTNSADPMMRKSAVDQMRAAGYDLPMNIDYTSLTPDQQIRMMDLVEKQKKAMSSLNPMDYEGEAKNVAMMAANVQLNLTDSDKAVFAQNQAPLIASLLQQGKTGEAKKIIYDAAVTNLSQSRKDVADRRAMVSYLDYAIGRLESASDLPGFYTGKWNDAQKYFGQQQDAAYRDIASVVALASVESLHELYGSALTENEMETARTILPLKGSNMLDAIQQLKNFRAYQNNKQEQIVNGISGGGAFGPGSNVGTTSNAPTNEGMGNIMNGGEETTIETSMINNKTITGRPSAIAALERANQAMIADGLEGLIVNSSFRDTAQQTAAYERFKRGEIARAAPPGTSLHEKGIAFDITNWKKAEKYLVAQGFNPLPANIRSSDPAHFSFLHIG